MNQSLPSSTGVVGEGRIAKTTLYYLTFIALGLCTASFGPTLPGLAAHTQSRISDVSFLFTARSIGYFLGSLLAGRLFDRYRGHVVLAGGLALMVIMLALTPVIPMLWVLTIVLAVLGVAESFVDVGNNSMLVWVHRAGVAPFMNGLHFFFGVGAFISPIIIAQVLLATGDITWAYWVLALIIAPTIVLVLRLPSPKALPSSSHPAGDAVNYVLVGLVVLFFFLYVSAEVGYAGWIYTYAVKLGLTDQVNAAYLTSTFWVALTIGRLLSVFIATRFSPRAVLTADLTGCVVSVLIALAFPTSLTAIWIATFGLGIAMASIFPTTLSFAERRMHMSAKVNSWFFAGSAAGSMLVPWLIGVLFEAVGPQVVIHVVAVAMGLAVLDYIALLRYTKGSDHAALHH